MVEKRQPGKYRITWNCSHLARRHRQSAIVDGGGTRWPVVVNIAAVLPPWLGFDWPSIQSTAAAMDIMADGAVSGGSPLLLRTIDLEAWFRMFAEAGAERWKVVIYPRGGYHADLRMEMGKNASTHHGKGTTDFTAEVLNTAAAAQSWGTKRGGRNNETAWVQKRRHTLGPAHARAVTVINFQDDLLVIAIDRTAAADFETALKQVIVAELDLQLSKKLEIVRPFALSADFIGAYFDVSDTSRPTFEPAARFLPHL